MTVHDCGTCYCYTDEPEELATLRAENERLRQAFRAAIEEHFLSYIECDHERKLDNPQCACSLVHLGWHPTVGDAVRAWADHVLAALDAATPEAGQ